MTGWLNTWICGPGAHQQIIDTLELGPRVAIPWASGRAGCVSDLQTPELLRALDPTPPPHHPQRAIRQTTIDDFLEAT